MFLFPRIFTYNTYQEFGNALGQAVRFNLGVRVKTHPRNQLKAIEKIFCALPKLKYEEEKDLDKVFENSLFVIGAYSNGLLAASNAGLPTFSCAELDVSFPTTYSLNLIENGVKIVTLDEAFKDIHMIAKTAKR